MNCDNIDVEIRIIDKGPNEDLLREREAQPKRINEFW